MYARPANYRAKCPHFRETFTLVKLAEAFFRTVKVYALLTYPATTFPGVYKVGFHCMYHVHTYREVHSIQ